MFWWALIIFVIWQFFKYLDEKRTEVKSFEKNNQLNSNNFSDNDCSLSSPTFESFLLTYWGGWSSEIHYLKDQRNQIEYAYSINPDKVTINISDQTSKFNSVKTSLGECTCKYFQNNRLPCRHIYFLALELSLPIPNHWQTQRPSKIQSDQWTNQIRNSMPDDWRLYRARLLPYDGDFWGGWSFAIHHDPKQQSRITNAQENPDYQTTLWSCTCPDFTYRRLPCKHIYGLATKERVFQIATTN